MMREKNTMDKHKQTRTKIIIASIPFVLVMVVLFASNPKASMAKLDLKTSDKVMFDGGSDYAAQCVRCHGGDGRGQTAKGRQTRAGDLTKSNISDAKGIRMITNGSGEMPAFKSSMNAEQIRGVMSYIHGFRR
jgi:cytochrome c6